MENRNEFNHHQEHSLLAINDAAAAQPLRSVVLPECCHSARRDDVAHTVIGVPAAEDAPNLRRESDEAAVEGVLDPQR
jgi:hypothetical protein